jgi:hypothetical protein
MIKRTPPRPESTTVAYVFHWYSERHLGNMVWTWDEWRENLISLGHSSIVLAKTRELLNFMSHDSIMLMAQVTKGLL